MHAQVIVRVRNQGNAVATQHVVSGCNSCMQPIGTRSLCLSTHAPRVHKRHQPLGEQVVVGFGGRAAAVAVHVGAHQGVLAELVVRLQSSAEMGLKSVTFSSCGRACTNSECLQTRSVACEEHGWAVDSTQKRALGQVAAG